MPKLPKYSELPIIEKTGERHAWSVWGKDDQLGMINLLTPERVVRAASLVKKGKVFNLEPSRSLPHPGGAAKEYASGKPSYEHHIHVSRTGRSDSADKWELHGGLGHMDGLRHMRYREFGYYGGRQEEDLDKGVMLGIERWAQHGLVGRGVFLDVPHYFEKRGEKLDPNKRFPIRGDLMEAIAKQENVKFEPGDIMLLRTGWMRWYLGITPKERAEAHERDEAAGGLECPGIDNDKETAGWLWDHQFTLLCADNQAVEALRTEGSDFQHRRILALFGMGIGELFTFEELSQDCAQDGVYECMFTAKPVNIPGAVGSPAHAYAIK